MSEVEATPRGKGCAMILFIIAPGTAGAWILYGPGLGLLSVPLWLVISIAISGIFWGKSKTKAAQ